MEILYTATAALGYQIRYLRLQAMRGEKSSMNPASHDISYWKASEHSWTPVGSGDPPRRAIWLPLLDSHFHIRIVDYLPVVP